MNDEKLNSFHSKLQNSSISTENLDTNKLIDNHENKMYCF